MLDNLKIAVKRQKKLLIIFLITIFLPSIALSVFGIRSIRNEKFRLVKQLEDEHKRASTALFPLESAQREKLERAQSFEFRQKNFYFLTILTILVLLTFGTVLVVRTIAHEMEVLRIKSDFVSSISHEFKTPITSIKALIERFFSQRV